MNEDQKRAEAAAIDQTTIAAAQIAKQIGNLPASIEGYIKKGLSRGKLSPKIAKIAQDLTLNIHRED